jgi:hypothetical protein
VAKFLKNLGNCPKSGHFHGENVRIPEKCARRGSHGILNEMSLDVENCKAATVHTNMEMESKPK